MFYVFESHVMYKQHNMLASWFKHFFDMTAPLAVSDQSIFMLLDKHTDTDERGPLLAADSVSVQSKSKVGSS
jgi:hypothetical protein